MSSVQSRTVFLPVYYVKIELYFHRIRRNYEIIKLSVIEG